jgi:hypothetical protein
MSSKHNFGITIYKNTIINLDNVFKSLSLDKKDKILNGDGSKGKQLIGGQIHLSGVVLTEDEIFMRKPVQSAPQITQPIQSQIKQETKTVQVQVQVQVQATKPVQVQATKPVQVHVNQSIQPVKSAHDVQPVQKKPKIVLPQSYSNVPEGCLSIDMSNGIDILAEREKIKIIKGNNSHIKDKPIVCDNLVSFGTELGTAETSVDISISRKAGSEKILMLNVKDKTFMIYDNKGKNDVVVINIPDFNRLNCIKFKKNI